MEKNMEVIEYIDTLSKKLNDNYQNILSDEQISRAKTMFVNSSDSIELIKNKINVLAKQTIEEYVARKEKQANFIDVTKKRVENLNRDYGIHLNEKKLANFNDNIISQKLTKEQIDKRFEIVDEIIQKMFEERELKKQEFIKKQKELRQAKFEELRKLYLETKEKYQNMDYSIVQTMDTKYMQSYNETKEVQLMNQLGETLYGFYKGVSSPNEYELLVSRLGKICDIPVADYSLYLDNGTIDGISISCIPDKERYDFISGYDFVKIYPEVSEVVSKIKNNPHQPKPELSRGQTQYYIDILLKGFEEKVKNPEQLEQLKKDYFRAVLFNAILDQKDFNYTNFAVLYDKVNDSYQMAPLFDNGAIKNNDSLEGTFIITLGRSKKEDVIDLLFTEYYDYVSDFAKQLVSENEKLNNGETSMISDMMTCIDDTIIHSEAKSYKQVVQSTLEKVVEREKINYLSRIMKKPEIIENKTRKIIENDFLNNNYWNDFENQEQRNGYIR